MMDPAVCSAWQQSEAYKRVSDCTEVLREPKNRRVKGWKLITLTGSSLSLFFLLLLQSLVPLSLLFVAAKCVFRCVRCPCECIHVSCKSCTASTWTLGGARGKRKFGSCLSIAAACWLCQRKAEQEGGLNREGGSQVLFVCLCSVLHSTPLRL